MAMNIKNHKILATILFFIFNLYKISDFPNTNHELNIECFRIISSKELSKDK